MAKVETGPMVCPFGSPSHMRRCILEYKEYEYREFEFFVFSPFPKVTKWVVLKRR